MLTQTCSPSAEEAEASQPPGSLSRQLTLIVELNQVGNPIPKSKIETPEEQ